MILSMKPSLVTLLLRTVVIEESSSSSHLALRRVVCTETTDTDWDAYTLRGDATQLGNITIYFPLATMQFF